MKIGLIAAAFAVCATAATAQTLSVDGDDATYTVIELSVGGPADKTITTRRADAAGTTFTKHAVSCEPYRAGLMGSGGSLETMNEGLNASPEMAEIIRFSAEDVIAGYACAN